MRPAPNSMVSDELKLASLLRAASEEMVIDAVSAQRRERLRSRHAVDREAAVCLERANRRFGFRPEDAIDFDSAERLLEQLDLAAFAAGAEGDGLFGRGRAVRARWMMRWPPKSRQRCLPSVRPSAPREPRERCAWRVSSAGTNRSSAARRRARERPSESSHRSPRGEVALLLCASAAGEQRGEGKRTTVVGLATGARPRAARERAFKGSSSRGRHRQDHAGIPACEASFLHCLAPTGLAVGLA